MSDEYCDLCDLPRSQCIHGMPAPVPAPKKAAAPRSAAPPRPRSAARSTPARPVAPARPVNRRWTPPEELAPLILTVLRQAGGELDAEDLFLQLEIALEDRLREGDNEKTPEGELRWRYAARRARVALIQEGLMTKGRPGVWQLA